MTVVAPERELIAPLSTPVARGGRLARLAARYERSSRPRTVLALVALALYAPSLGVPFIVDDYRNLRLMEEFHRGQRPRLDLYRFFTDSADNVAQRMSGVVPWWLSDDLRFQYMRPIAEWSLYADYLIWGPRAGGHRLTSLALYVAAIWLALALFRAVQPDESTARWAALCFAVAACHAVPIVFVAGRCDLLSLALTLATVLAGLTYLRNGQPACALLCAGAYGAALLSKEAALPACAALALLWAATRRSLEPGARRAGDRRAVPLLLALVLAAAAWFGVRQSGHFETNVVHVMDPLRDTAEYLTLAPRRAAEFLATWLLPVNPAIFYYEPSGELPRRVLTVVGGIATLAGGVYLWRRRRGDAALGGFVAWTLVFLPVLVCAMPDDRLLMIPSVGLAYLSGAWLRSQPANGSFWNRWAARYVPATMFLVLPAFITLVTIAAVWGIEKKGREDLEAIVADVATSDPPPDRVFFFNAPHLIHAIWVADRARATLERESPNFAYLSDQPAVSVNVAGERTVQLTSPDRGFLTTLLGQFGLARGAEVGEGQRFRAAEVTVTALAVRDGRPGEIEIEFDEPLSSPRYAFYTLDNDGPPRRWRPPGAAPTR